MNADELITTAITWTHTGNGEFPYRARVDGRVLTIRINDFPAEPLYTLLINGADRADGVDPVDSADPVDGVDPVDPVDGAELDDWPDNWVRPAIPQHLIDLTRPDTRDT